MSESDTHEFDFFENLKDQEYTTNKTIQVFTELGIILPDNLKENFVMEDFGDIHEFWSYIPDFTTFQKVFLKFFEGELPVSYNHCAPLMLESKLIKRQLINFCKKTSAIPLGSHPYLELTEFPLQKSNELDCKLIQIPYLDILVPTFQIPKLFEFCEKKGYIYLSNRFQYFPAKYISWLNPGDRFPLGYLVRDDNFVRMNYYTTHGVSDVQTISEVTADFPNKNLQKILEYEYEYVNIIDPRKTKTNEMFQDILDILSEH